MPVKRYIMFANMFGLLLFGTMLAGVLGHNSLLTVDRWVSTNMPLVRLDWLTPIIKILTDIDGVLGASLFSVGVVALLVWKKQYRHAIFYLTVVLGAMGLFILVKQLVIRSRPGNAMIEIGGYSFPSGHTTMATAIAFALYFILSQMHRWEPYKRILFFLALGWVLLIASTRLYLGVHWFSDVAGGFGLGLFWVTAVKLWFHPLSYALPGHLWDIEKK